MNPQYLNLLRTVMQIAGTFLVTKNLVSQADWTAIMGAILMLTPAIWGVLATRKNSIIATVDGMKGVSGVITDTSPEGLAIANSVPSPTVVPAGTIAATTVAQTTNPTKGD